MKKLLTTLWKGIISFLTTDTIIMLIAYIGLLFCLTIGFSMIWTIWKALIG
jgi:hypothetical protein